ncbi:hypothetical protein BDV96DRAFT_647349 [Lophiotrema nucula]|uniref:Uncharacterized protein n=1 Tax=Lophiotrema nucula TaxID=690887 RepID=A0A6A5Z5M8_9PLEO|nr:hypothetical protein BDV96DRAFT_647349 [Lophiotrema nucula]
MTPSSSNKKRKISTSEDTLAKKLRSLIDEFDSKEQPSEAEIKALRKDSAALKKANTELKTTTAELNRFQLENVEWRNQAHILKREKEALQERLNKAEAEDVDCIRVDKDKWTKINQDLKDAQSEVARLKEAYSTELRNKLYWCREYEKSEAKEMRLQHELSNLKGNLEKIEEIMKAE